MIDHQLFEERRLANGITLYVYRDRFPISCMEVQLPVGSAHAIPENGFLPGSPHFMEHVQLIRSEKYPEAYALDKELGRKAGNSNAATHPTKTTHWVDTPKDQTQFGIDTLIERVFHPIFNEQDLAVERSVVMNERNQNKFYPGKNKTSQYYYTQFLEDTFYPIEQVFGSDQDLEQMTAPAIQTMHQRISTSEQIVALAVGDDDFSYFEKQLAALPTKPHNFVHTISPTGWSKKDYHTAYFDTVPQPRLEVAWVHQRPSFEEYRAVCFIITLLINTTNGPLYHELREEKGWTYGLDALCLLRDKQMIHGLTFPLNDEKQVAFVRQNLHERIQTACKDQSLIEDEISRQLGNQVYNYQTAGSIVSSASEDLITYGKIYTEAGNQKAVEAMRDPAWVSQIVGTYFKPEDMGSMCFMPERRGN